jgi:hypothetical protein
MSEGKHYIATALRFSGSGHGIPFGKCRCGAYMADQAEIDAHRAIADEEKNFSGKSDA